MVAYLQDDFTSAAKLPAVTATLNVEWRALESSSHPHEILHFERIMAVVPQYRQESVFEAAWQAGEKLDFGEAIELALAV
jgi:hypothetical protein